MRLLFALPPAALPLAALTASAAAAYDPIVLERGWERVARFENDRCFGEAGGNGRFYVLKATGFAPGEPLVLTIANGDMVPIERVVRADASGIWSDYYIPFRPNRGEGGTVAVTLAGASCVVPLDFAWSRAKGWAEPEPLKPR